jgi:hypothetical protein
MGKLARQVLGSCARSVVNEGVQVQRGIDGAKAKGRRQCVGILFS